MIQDLQAYIERYLNDGRSRSIQGLATRSGVSYSTVRRIAQGEVKTASLGNVLNILKVVAKWEDSLDFLKQHFPESGKYFEMIGAKAAIKEEIPEELERSLFDNERFVIISLASTPTGTTRPQIVAVLGEGAAIKLDGMLDSGVLVQKDGQFFPCQEEFASTDNINIINQIRHTLPFIRDEHIGRQIQHCALHTKGLTREAQKEAHRLIQDTMVKLTELAKSSPGPIPVFYGAIMGSFTSEAK